MNKTDTIYLELLRDVLDNGRVKKNRTEIDTIGVFGRQARFNLAEGFPLLTTKKVYFRSVVRELLWFLSGSTNIKYLVDNDVHIWDDNCFDKYDKAHPPSRLRDRQFLKKEEFIAAIKNPELAFDKDFIEKWGNLGEGTYGGMWRRFPYAGDLVAWAEHTNHHEIRFVDQIQKVIDKLKSNPDDRRLIVSAWHPYWVDHCALPPCHVLFQFQTEELTLDERMNYAYEFKGLATDLIEDSYTEIWLEENNIPKRRLNCQLYQRSCDLFLGVPFNIASYALLTSMMAQVVNMVPGEFIHTYGDLHIYSNHINQAKEQLSREPRELPTLKLNPDIKNIFNFKYGDISIDGYNPHPAIKADMAV